MPLDPRRIFLLILGFDSVYNYSSLYFPPSIDKPNNAPCSSATFSSYVYMTRRLKGKEKW